MHRLFAAIRPPEAVREQLLDLMEGSERLRWQDDDQLHLTLRFIGELEGPQAEDVALALRTIRFPPFLIRLAGVGCFTHRRHGTLWTGAVPRDLLARLSAKIDRACVSAGLEPEHRAYHPHVTLARWSGREPSLQPFLQQHGGFTSAPWEVDRFELLESRLLRDGARYDSLEQYALAA